MDRVSTEVNKKHGGEILVSKTIAEKSKAIIRLRPLTKRVIMNHFKFILGGIEWFFNLDY